MRSRGTIWRVRRFNSRTREGCDSAAWSQRRGASSFNSRTREGCDSKEEGQWSHTFTFQFTHPRGVRQSPHRTVVSRVQFQFTHPRRVRPGTWTATVYHLSFQFTHPRRVRLTHYTPHDRLGAVSIHAPPRGATAGMGRWLWSCLYRPALAKVLKLSLLSGAAST